MNCRGGCCCYWLLLYGLLCGDSRNWVSRCYNTYMTVRAFTFGSLFTGIAGLSVFLLVLTQLSPQRAGWLGVVLLFLSLFLGFASIAGLVGYAVRRVIVSRQFVVYAVRTSLRQGILLGLFFTVLLFLQYLRLYRWWLAIILIVFSASFELVFLSYDRNRQRLNRAIED